VFQSIDSFGHICTVTGALYKGSKLGRWFDGGGAADDLINCGSLASIDNIFDGGGTIAAWVNPASEGEAGGRVLSKSKWYIHLGNEAAGKTKIYFTINWTAGATFKQWSTTDTELTLNVPTRILITYNSDAAANNAIIYVNGSVVVAPGSADPAGARSDDSAFGLIVGNAVGGTNTTDGYIMEVTGWNRILTATEAAYDYAQGRYL